MVKRIFFSSLVLSLLIIPLSAAVMVPLSLSEMVQKSDLIVVGEVLDNQPSRWGTNSWGDELIYTDYTIAVTDTVKGAVKQEVTVTLEGGTVGDVSLTADHMPTFNKGERVVLFLRDQGGEWMVYSGLQGKLTVDENGFVAKGKVALVDLKQRIQKLLEK